jgi:hypothetical protein
LTSLQRLALTKFIKVHFSDKNNSKVDRIRPWLLAKINNSHIPPASSLQKGCPDIIPGLRAKPWWYIWAYLGIAHSFRGCCISNKTTKRYEIKYVLYAIKKVSNPTEGLPGYLSEKPKMV